MTMPTPAKGAEVDDRTRHEAATIYPALTEAEPSSVISAFPPPAHQLAH